MLLAKHHTLPAVTDEQPSTADMNRYGEEARQSPLEGNREPPVMTPTSRHPSDPLNGDPMDVTPPPPPSSTTMGPPTNTSPNGEHTTTHNFTSSNAGESGISNNPSSAPTVSGAANAAAATQQPKLVQTAFIHKLYKYVWILLPRHHALIN